MYYRLFEEKGDIRSIVVEIGAGAMLFFFMFQSVFNRSIYIFQLSIKGYFEVAKWYDTCDGSGSIGDFFDFFMN